MPTYTWNAVPNSTWYYLWVDDSIGNKIRQWYKAADAGCSSGTGIRSLTPGTALAVGAGKWWVQTWNSIGSGPWSDGVAFTAPVPILPGKATLISPSGGVSTSMPTYLWNADPNATWYFLWVDDTTGNKIQQWYNGNDGGFRGSGTLFGNA